MEREQEREKKKLLEINLNKFPVMGMGSGGMGSKSLPKRPNSGREHNQLNCWDRINGTSIAFFFFFFSKGLETWPFPFFLPQSPTP